MCLLGHSYLANTQYHYSIIINNTMAMVALGGVIALLLLATLALVYYGYGTGTNIDNLQHDETRLLLLEDPKTTIDKDIPTKCTNGPYVYTRVLSASAFQENMVKCTLPLGRCKH